MIMLTHFILTVSCQAPSVCILVLLFYQQLDIYPILTIQLLIAPLTLSQWDGVAGSFGLRFINKDLLNFVYDQDIQIQN